MEEAEKDSNNLVKSSQETATLNNPQEETRDKINVEPSSVKDNGDKQLLANREELITVAVKFLQNPKVQSSSLQLKRSFLLKKGLREQEIQTALDRVGLDSAAGTTTQNSTTPRHYETPSTPRPYVHNSANHYNTPSLGQEMAPYQIQTHQNSVSSKLRDLANFLVLIGGASYAINFLWKRYLRPWLYGIANPQPKQALLTTVQTLLQSVETLKTGVMQLQKSLDKYEGSVDKLAEKVDTVKGDNDGWRQTLIEVKSVKGLMLGSQQFPAHPPTPTIPAWQRLDTSQIDPDIIVTVDKDGGSVKEDSDGSGKEDSGSGKSSRGSSEIELIGEDIHTQFTPGSYCQEEGAASQQQLETC